MLTRIPSRSRALRRDQARAFTLLEIMIALAILGLLVGLAITNIGSIFGGSQKTVAEIFVKQTLRTPLENYKIQMNGYPSSLQDLMTAPAGKSSKWNGPYVLEDTKWPPVDPWEELYIYKYPGVHNPRGYDLYSKGPDKLDGTADDIGNWEVSEAGADATDTSK